MHAIGIYASKQYRQVIDAFWSQVEAAREANDGGWDFPTPPQWSKDAGWTKYTLSSNAAWVEERVPFPKTQVIVFDVETAPGIEGEVQVGERQIEGTAKTCTRYASYPLMAVARSATHWYTWTAPTITAGHMSPFDASLGPRLIPLGRVEDGGALVVIGHNVSYDRARVLEEYSASVCWPDLSSENQGGRRYLDTLSLHCSVAGISSQQRGPWRKEANLRQQQHGDDEDLAEIDLDGADGVEELAPVEDKPPKWINMGSMNNLVDAVTLHCSDSLEDPLIAEFLRSKKDCLSLILEATDLEDIRENHSDITSYCSRDVGATLALFYELWGRWPTEMCPHPITLAAVLEMGSRMALTVQSPGWPDYIESCQQGYSKAVAAMENILRELVDKVIAENRSTFHSDPWLKKLDWTPIPAKYTKARYLKNGQYAKDGEPRPYGNVALFGKPAWYKALYHKGQVQISARTRILPYLLRMTWEGQPVHWVDKHGWCFQQDSRTTSDAGQTGGKHGKLPITDPNNPALAFKKIPHPEREGSNVGCLFAKAFLPLIDSGVISSSSDSAKELLHSLGQSSTSWSFWTGYRERITQQLVIWQGEPGTDIPYTEPRLGLLIPALITMGTVTRRAVESTWMTASNSKPRLAGSELKSRIVAPPPPPPELRPKLADSSDPGYVLIGADVDSQELWIASLIGDSQFGESGATALAWMTLQGTKADGTDLHSRTASILGMSRDAAKVFNYGRIYGAGARYAAELLCKFNPKIAPEEAREKAHELYAATKGERTYNKTRDPFVVYSGGTESYMFNAIEAMARSPVTRTPCLGARISDALCSENVDEEFLTSRVNWVVQSSGVDYLHMLVTIMSVLSRLYRIPTRLLLTIHDEVRYLVPSSHRLQAAMALQLANLWTRAYFAHRLGMQDLPLGVAFFSGIDFDTVLRKDPMQPCVTPTSPNPIQPGITFDIHQLAAEINKSQDIRFEEDAQVMKEIGDALLGYRETRDRFDLREEANCVSGRSPQAWLRRLEAQADVDVAAGRKTSRFANETPKSPESKKSSKKAEARYSNTREFKSDKQSSPDAKHRPASEMRGQQGWSHLVDSQPPRR